jgi:adenine phosphoribosyltransferase
MLLKEVYKKAKVIKTGKHFTTINEFSDQIPGLRPEVLWEAARGVIKIGNFNADKIITEEDKGAPLATLVSVITGLPLAMARWYPYSLGVHNEVQVKIQSEYFQGTLYVNGIQPGERVTIVDDTISTGGTLISLIQAIQEAGAIVADVICVIEKVGNEGVRRVYEKTNVHVKSILKIMVTEDCVEILE